MEFEWKTPIVIEDGQHTGTITKIEYKDEPYRYCNVWVEVDTENDSPVSLKYGVPQNLSPVTKLGMLLITFGAEFVAGEKANPETYLLSKRCKFMTLKKSKEGKEFSEIVDGSLKPEVEVEKPQV